MIVKLQLKKASNEIIYKNAITTFEKGSFYCVEVAGPPPKNSPHFQGWIVKYPLNEIFRVIEEYHPYV